MIEVNKNMLNKLRPLFKDIRFYMGRSVLDGMLGEAFTDNLDSPRYAYLHCKSYYFINGEITEEELKEIVSKAIKNEKCVIIPSDEIGKVLEKLYKENFYKKERYSIKKNPSFDKNKLQSFVKKLNPIYELKDIDKELSERIKKENFRNITDNFEKHGIGACCLYNNELVGVCASNIIYNDGIEVNIRTKEGYQRQGIAAAMASKLILDCLKCDKKISWDAANLNSLGLAEKLGFEYDSTYYAYLYQNK
ncbi:MAG: GNAT family N-acetyltransferase [Bacilli bacterium]|nr:GNAT family N-acetyltransferase [Bacilli bacterium]